MNLLGSKHEAPFAVALLTLGLTSVACYPKSAPAPGAISPDEVARASTRWPGATAESLSKGRDLFLAKCNACHGYPDLSAIPEERWPTIVERMAKKADLASGGGDAVLHYVLAARTEHASP